MTWATAHQTIRDYFAANWTQTEIAWENQQFNLNNQKPFVAFEIVTMDDEQASFGQQTGNFFRHRAVIYLHLHCPHTHSQSEIEVIAEALAAVFRAKTLTGGIVCEAPRLVPPDTNGPFRVLPVAVPFYVDSLA